MPFLLPLAQAQADYPEYVFVGALTPSEQKAAFHVRNSSGAELCLKIIAPGYNMDRLQREVGALRTLTHPNIASFQEYVFASTPTGQRHHLVEEFIAGEDLTQSLVPGSAWSRSEVASFFTGLANGLMALKSANIVHRDLKPTNIRRRQDGTPVIIDFGMARHLDLPDITNTHEGAGFGTPAYFAPEQFTGTKRDIDHRTDLFAFGILIYQALVGQHPFLTSTSTMTSLRDAICNSDVHLTAPGFVALPDQWKLLVKKLLEKERGKRLQGADQAVLLLTKFASI